HQPRILGLPLAPDGAVRGQPARSDDIPRPDAAGSRPRPNARPARPAAGVPVQLAANPRLTARPARGRPGGRRRADRADGRAVMAGRRGARLAGVPPAREAPPRPAADLPVRAAAVLAWAARGRRR